MGQHARIPPAKHAGPSPAGRVNMQEWWVNINKNGGSTCAGIYTVFTTDKKLLAGMHLKMFESMLPADQFFRVHRSFIVNLSKISSINGNMAEIGQTEIPIGANYKNELMKKLGIAG